MIEVYEDAFAAVNRGGGIWHDEMRAAFKAGARAALNSVVWQPGGCIDGAHVYVGAAKPLAEALAELDDAPEQEKEA